MFWLKFLIFFVYLFNKTYSFTFNEELHVEQLPNSFLEFQFRFTSKWNRNLNQKIENYNLFPKRIADIVSKFRIKELHLTLSQGVWRQHQWGLPSLYAPTGAELWIAFEDNLSQEVLEEYWIQSSRTISGLFGLSINLIDSPNTVKPKFLFNSSTNNDNVRYASIPNEFLCTENLTPWMKLLPCVSKGIAQLLENPPKLFESHYFLLGLHFKQSCQDNSCNQRQLELSQTLSLVYDTSLFKNRNEQETLWSLASIFTQKIKSFCPVSSLSNVYMDLKTNGISNTKPSSIINLNNKEVYVYDLKEIFAKTDDFNPVIVFKTQKDTIKVDEIISAHRYITDPNEIDFGLKTMIINNKNYAVSLVYFDTIPWYFRVYFNSLKIECNGTQIKPDFITFTPGLDRKRPHHVELSFNLNSNTICSVYFKAEYAFLKFDEYPPDVNHGFHINPALISIKLPASVDTAFKPVNVFSTLFDIVNIRIDLIKDKLINVYTETLLMNLPTPDFSMPYNVICLTCTAIAIGFGSIHNFTTRKFKFSESKTFKEKIKDFIGKLFKKKTN